MAGNVRVYELARELGMANKAVIELCGSLGIGVKSHSSGMVEAQADRVRKKAVAEGLIQEPKEEIVKEVEEPVVEEPVVEEPVVEEPVVEELSSHQISESSSGNDKRIISSSGSTAPSRRDDDLDDLGLAESKMTSNAEGERSPKPSDLESKVDSPINQASPSNAKPPMSSSGKPIPPPPGVKPPMSSSGKPIPPPPGGQTKARTSDKPPPGQRTTPLPAGRRPSSGGGPRESVPGAGPQTAKPGGRPGKPGDSRRGVGAGPDGPRRRKKKGRRRKRTEELQPMDAPSYTPEDTSVPEGEIIVERASSAQEVGPKLNRTAADLVRFLMQQGEMVTATQSLSDDMIELFAAEIGAEVIMVDPGEEQEAEILTLLDVSEGDIAEDAPSRPPVVTVMGHVDHGKTKLLDQIRNTNLVDAEAGGITQHIGAYQIVKDGRKLTFIDTPGHEAFTLMRARGADSTDIVVLVVAADDGVMPQTVEAISHARAAEVPIVVAINKVDRENADIQKVLSQLAENDLVPESWGGDTVTVEVSALENMGVDDLLENLGVVAELEDLRADPEERARGVVLESNLDIGRGPVATILVQQGTLKVGDPVVAGAAWGRARALIDDRGEQIDLAGPSTPVQLLGLDDVAQSGDMFVVAPNEKLAGRVAEKRGYWRRQASIARDSHALSGGARLEDIFEQIQRGEKATLNLIVKADANGSLEAVVDSLRRLEREEVQLAFVHRGVGRISENDIQLAATSNATIIGFNVRPERKAREFAETEKVEIRTYEIIYELLDDIESAMVGMLTPVFEEVVSGEAEVREIFSIPRIGKIAGCYVTEGVIARGSKVRFLREGTIIWKGEVSSLRRFKEDVREVQSGYECGIGLSDFQDLKQGDVIETFEQKEIVLYFYCTL